MKSDTVYLVGDDKSPKTNQWMAMTPDLQTAQEYMRENGLTQLKAVDARKRRGAKR